MVNAPKKSKGQKEKAIKKAEDASLPEVAHYPLFTLRKEIDQLFEDAFAHFPLAPFRRWSFDWPPMREFERSVPEMDASLRTDVSETNNNYVVRAELPGMDEKDLEVTLSGGVLTIKGEKRTQRDEKEEDYHLSECRYGSFQRSFQLPSAVDQDNVNAQFDNGVLTLTIPKIKTGKSKKITIKSAVK